MNRADQAPDEVGGRQGVAAPAAPGGGYQDICTVTESGVPRELSLDELRRMGLAEMWLEVSELVGPDRFVRIWECIDRHASEDYGNLRIRIPRFRRFLRYQRNRYIQTLARSGCSAPEIQRRLERELGESLHVEHVRKLVYRLRQSGTR